MNKNKKTISLSLILLAVVVGLVLYLGNLYKELAGFWLMYIPLLIMLSAMYMIDEKYGNYFIIFLIIVCIIIFMVSNFM